MLTEVTHLQDILQSLCAQAADPDQLPAAGEQILKDIRGAAAEQTWAYQVSVRGAAAEQTWAYQVIGDEL